jgi:predicted nucleotidyltransferase
MCSPVGWIRANVEFMMDQLLAILRAEMPHLVERFGVRSLALFGSYVRGEATDLSDVDILVEYERAPTLFEFVRLQAHLADLLGLPVDLVMRSALKPRIGAAILAELVPV